MLNSRPLRVLIAAPSQGKYGGLEAFVLALAESMVGVADLSPRICLKLVRGAVLSDELRARCEKIGVPYSVVSRASFSLYQNLYWADLVHVQNPSPDITFGTHLSGRPLVMTIINHRSKTKSLHTRLWDWAVRATVFRCYISEFVRSTWEPHGKKAGSRVIPAVPHLPEREITWGRNGFFFIGRWIANKGLEELITAYATAQIDRTRWPLTLAGDGPLRPEIEQLIAKHALTNVRLVGFIGDEEKFTLMRHAKWNVAPPHTQEDLGMTPIEARYLAVPSIITRDGGLPEAAGPEALIAEPGDVASLRSRLEEAAAMPTAEYNRRALASLEQLDKFLVPLSEYHNLYRQTASWRE